MCSLVSIVPTDRVSDTDPPLSRPGCVGVHTTVVSRVCALTSVVSTEGVSSSSLLLSRLELRDTKVYAP